VDPDPDPGAQKHVDLVDPDPDPEHCLQFIITFEFYQRNMCSQNSNICTYYWLSEQNNLLKFEIFSVLNKIHPDLHVWWFQIRAGS
jgi:hypothetical protein